MKKIFFATFIFLVFLSLGSLVQGKESISYFYADWCPHCQKVNDFFEKNGIYEKYEVAKYNIDDAENSKLLAQAYMEKEYNGRGGIPTVLFNDKLLVGDGDIINYFKKGIENENAKGKNISMSVLISAALVDAINPCAFAVLILLVATVIGARGRSRALIAGLLFSLTVFVSYFLMGLGLYKVITIFNLPKILSIIVGALAILIGLANFKDAFWHGKFFLMEVPINWRPKMKAILTGVTGPLGSIGAGFIVSLFLLPCTSGPYIVILGLLADRVEMAKTMSWLALYNLIFISPMILITLAMYFGLRGGKLEEWRIKNVRLLHAIAGVIMLVIGIYLIYSWI